MTLETPSAAPPKPKFGKGQPASYCGKKGRSGPKAGVPQRNGTSITRLPLGDYPATMRKAVTRAARKYRRDLESLVVKMNAGINTTEAHLIDEAASAEAHGSVCRWLLRTRLEKMTVTDVLKCSEQIIKAKMIRNRAVERLALDKPIQPPWVLLAAPADSGNDGEARE
jgi:hypothetical protein